MVDNRTGDPTIYVVMLTVPVLARTRMEAMEIVQYDLAKVDRDFVFEDGLTDAQRLFNYIRPATQEEAAQYMAAMGWSVMPRMIPPEYQFGGGR